MKNIFVTPLEEKLFNEIIKPAVHYNFTRPVKHAMYTESPESETANFAELFLNLKEFYKRNGGEDWHGILMKEYTN